MDDVFTLKRCAKDVFIVVVDNILHCFHLIEPLVIMLDGIDMVLLVPVTGLQMKKLRVCVPSSKYWILEWWRAIVLANVASSKLRLFKSAHNSSSPADNALDS